MGIDFHVESKKNPVMYGTNDPNQFLKWAWRNIRWEEIFECVNIDMSPYIYYEDPGYNYRSPQDVEDMRDNIKRFVDKVDELYDADEYYRLRDELHEDAVKLLELFDYYVENEAYITIY